MHKPTLLAAALALTSAAGMALAQPAPGTSTAPTPPANQAQTQPTAQGQAQPTTQGQTQAQPSAAATPSQSGPGQRGPGAEGGGSGMVDGRGPGSEGRGPRMREGSVPGPDGHAPWMMGPYAYQHGGMMHPHHRPPRPSRAASFHVESGNSEVHVRCAEGEPTRACVDAAIVLLDKLATMPAR
ncbi:hypothetical protein J8J14_01970 [Roseomonas sp. SSH11]|uniref:Uncharacterized protein n=1 Tax=Pararoseomonas baculiformis TaxID=2820812 RepID=A0ABS4A970_9PROT|nr:hypothetical protein [Pararoseomonas baculiformis]MBP0443534.1 hypothetical protein [Pararoseomonas baculiformis]